MKEEPHHGHTFVIHLEEIRCSSPQKVSEITNFSLIFLFFFIYLLHDMPPKRQPFERININATVTQFRRLAILAGYGIAPGGTITVCFSHVFPRWFLTCPPHYW